MEFLKQYEILLKKAKTDLKVAKNTLRDFENGDEDLDLEVIMFHLQQCAEKLLKTLLVYNKYHVVKTHDIEELILTMNDQQIVVIENIEKTNSSYWVCS
ncbi:MAG: HEPN domain-containing protein [Sulfurimonas sp.]|nr:HEPN domain-containing protein [Sulfurimonas sp.]